jgi:hypothetical protein
MVDLLLTAKNTPGWRTSCEVYGRAGSKGDAEPAGDGVQGDQLVVAQIGGFSARVPPPKVFASLRGRTATVGGPSRSPYAGEGRRSGPCRNHEGHPTRRRDGRLPVEKNFSITVDKHRATLLVRLNLTDVPQRLIAQVFVKLVTQTYILLQTWSFLRKVSFLMRLIWIFVSPN